MANEIKKIYDISLIGEKDLARKMEAVNRSFDDAKKNFLALKDTLAKGGLSTDEMKNLKIDIENARLETIKLNQERIKLTNDGRALSNSLKQERLDRQANNDLLGKSTDAYKLASKELNEMRTNVKAIGKEFGITSPQFIEAARDLQVLDKELKSIDAAVGQFQRNVGNYPKEIKIGSLSQATINSLKNAGLGDALAGQINQVKRSADQLDQEFFQMKAEIDKVKSAGVTGFQAIEKQMIENRVEALKLRTEVRESTVSLNSFGDIGNGVMGKFNSSLSQVALGYVGFQAAASGIASIIRDTKELSDSTTSLEIELGKTVGGADKLVDGLSKIDTRTKLTVLEDIANVATKAGTAEQNLLGVTQAVDKASVAFGKDFGSIEDGTETFAKLINIFYDDREITGERILKIGNSVRTLANETVASVPYINDFTGRMAGLRQIFTNFELSQSIGLGAGFEEFKQSAEVSSTALTKILPKLAADTAKFAKILGIPQEEFKKLINDNPVEALIRVSEKLVKTKGGVEGIATAFADAELGAGRITTILGTLGGKADVFRERIKRAGETIQETTAIESAFEAKNQNLAGTMDKVSKKFSDTANSKGFVTFIDSVANILLFLIKIITAIPFSVIITGITLVSAAWLYYKGASISAGLAQQWNNEQMLLGQIRLFAQRIGLIANTEATVAQAVATEEAAVAQTTLNTAMSISPLGVILALLALLIPAMSAFASESDKAAISVRRYNDSEKIRQQVLEKSNKATSETITKIDLLVGSLKDAKVSVDTKKEAMSQLIKIDKEFDGVMSGNIVNLDKLKSAYDKVTESIKLKATAEATASLLAEREKEAAEIALLKKKLEIAGTETRQRSKNAAATVSLTGLTATEQSILGIDEQNLQFAQNQYDRYIKKVLAAEQKAAETYRKYAQINAEAQKALGITNKESTDTTPTVIPGAADPTKASKLTGDQKDFLRDINALREAELSELKKSKLEGAITEEEFLKRSLATNIKYNDQILDHFKGTDAVTRKLRADTAADSIDKQIETNDKLFKIQEEAAKQSLENDKARAQTKLDNVKNSPYSTEFDKVGAENVFYQEILDAQVNFNAQMDTLEREYSQNSKKNAQDRKNLLLKEQSDLNKSSYELSKSQLKSVFQAVDDFAEYRKNNAEIEASIRRINIEKDKSLTIDQKAHEIEKVNAALALESNNIELGGVIAKINFYEVRISKQRLTNDELKEYNRLLKERQLLEEGKASGEREVKIKGIVELELPSASSIQRRIQALFSDKNGKFIIGVDKLGNDVDGSALLGNVIAQSFDLANQAMDNYFANQQLQVENSKKQAYEQIDIEKNIRLTRAQSQSEKDSIEEQARVRKEKADKDASEKLKKIKKSEATIAYATQLANIATSASANPANAFTFGAAGIAMYAVLAAIATTGYLMNLSTINKQQFGRGGIPKKGGSFNGPSHDDGGIPVGMNEFEGDELAIINKKSAKSNKVLSVTGTPKQIASAINEYGGGVSFAPGAIFKRYAAGGYFGSSVQPPIFRSYYQSTSGIDSGSADRLDRIEQMILYTNEVMRNTNDTLSKEVHRKTYISSRDMSNAQGNDAKQSEIGTL